MTPQQYVQDKAASSGSSFYYAFMFLPPHRRAAITAFYAFCREVDDVVDEVHDPQVAATKLAWWQREVAQSFAGQPSHPVMLALMPLADEFGIEARHLGAVIEGCQTDLEQTRFLDFAGLQRIAIWWQAKWARWLPTSSAAARTPPWPTPTGLDWPCNSPTSSEMWVKTPAEAASTSP
jgi:hypothetical protein